MGIHGDYITNNPILGGGDYGYGFENPEVQQQWQPQPLDIPRPILGEGKYTPPSPEPSFLDKMANRFTRPAPNTYSADIPEADRRQNLWQALMMAGLKMAATNSQPYAGPARPGWSQALSAMAQLPMDTMNQYRQYTADDVAQLKAKAEEHNKMLAAQAAHRNAEGNYLRGMGTRENAQAAMMRANQPLYSFFPGYDESGNVVQYGVNQKNPKDVVTTGTRVQPKSTGSGTSPEEKRNKATFDDALKTTTKTFMSIGGQRAKNVDAAEQILRDVQSGARKELEKGALNSFMSAMANFEANWPNEAKKHSFYQDYLYLKEAANRMSSQPAARTGSINIGAGRK